jgi:hypothetical protein
MKYTKKQLLGAIFIWDSSRYIVIDNGDNVQLQHIANKQLFPSHTITKLNTCLDNLVLSSLKKPKIIQIY